MGAPEEVKRLLIIYRSSRVRGRRRRGGGGGEGEGEKGRGRRGGGEGEGEKGRIQLKPTNYPLQFL